MLWLLSKTKPIERRMSKLSRTIVENDKNLENLLDAMDGAFSDISERIGIVTHYGDPYKRSAFAQEFSYLGLSSEDKKVCTVDLSVMKEGVQQLTKLRADLEAMITAVEKFITHVEESELLG